MILDAATRGFDAPPPSVLVDEPDPIADVVFAAPKATKAAPKAAKPPAAVPEFGTAEYGPRRDAAFARLREADPALLMRAELLHGIGAGMAFRDGDISLGTLEKMVTSLESSGPRDAFLMFFGRTD